MIKKTAILTALLLAAAARSFAGRVIERELACPVCGQVFYARLETSRPQVEMRLDLKPVGYGPALLPSCPKCGFVTYRLPMPRAELAKCKTIVASEGYKKNIRRSTYFRLGLLYENLGAPAFTLANTYLKASWQEEKEAADLKDDQERSLKYFAACSLSCRDEEKENSQLLTVELLRRLGRFGEAGAALEKLRGLKGFQNNFFADILAYQAGLCRENDSSPHDMEEVRVSRMPFFSRVKWKTRKFLNSFRRPAADAS